MSITTTTPYKVVPGQTILKRISDGHYYGEVILVDRLTNRPHIWQDDFRVIFSDGDSKVLKAGSTVIVKE